MKFHPETHHRRSIRLQGYDYSRAGAYFVTICVQGWRCLFGEVANNGMVLNEGGKMVRHTWLNLGDRFQNLTVDEFIVMPNHFHGIIFLTDRRGEPCVRPFVQNDSANQGDHKDRPYGTSAGSVGRIIQTFKSLSTVGYAQGVERNAWPPFPGRLWQRNYYERIIRNDNELHRARKYITGNPAKWAFDDENPNHIPP
ncbi:MAG: transposase [Desulfuromonadales bacterium]